MAPIANIIPMVSMTETQAVISVEKVNVELAGETRQSNKKCIETAIVLASRLELGTCVLAVNLFFAFLVFVLVLLQTTHVLWVYNVYNSWLV